VLPLELAPEFEPLLTLLLVPLLVAPLLATPELLPLALPELLPLDAPPTPLLLASPDAAPEPLEEDPAVVAPELRFSPLEGPVVSELHPRSAPTAHDATIRRPDRKSLDAMGLFSSKGGSMHAPDAAGHLPPDEMRIAIAGTLHDTLSRTSCSTSSASSR
jgi:hypothetical protein